MNKTTVNQRRLSDEQQIIFNNVKDNKNVIVDAVAGTGKTTIILHTAEHLPHKTFLQMTYNSSLRLDVKSRAANLPNLHVHTFHSLAVRYYVDNAFTDTEIRKIVNYNIPPKCAIPKIDTFVLDEDQDCTFLYFKFISKFIRDMGSPVQLLILGDYMQGIYDFKGADIRFLTLADQIWSNFAFLKTTDFVHCKMSMSFRITNQMSYFLNNVMLGEQRIQACKDDQPVMYIRHNVYSSQTVILSEINRLLDMDVNPSQIFVLGASLKGEYSNIRKLENRLVENNIPCYVSVSENEVIDDRAIEGKLVFSTFHCVKGRQRQYVFVIGFDNSYYRFYQRDKPSDVCANTLYVATTRAERGLYVVESSQNDNDCPLLFLKMNHIEMKQQDYIDFRGMHQTIFYERNEDTMKQKITNTSPTDLIKFLPDSVIDEITPIMDKIFVVERKVGITIDIPNIIQTKNGLYEEVSDLNGIAIPCMYFDDLLGTRENGEPRSQINVLRNLIVAELEDMKRNKSHLYLHNQLDQIPEQIENVGDYLFMANLQFSIQEKLYFRMKQIAKSDYDWLTKEHVDACINRMHGVVDADCKNNVPPLIEKEIIESGNHIAHCNIDRFLGPHFENKSFRFKARVDLITDTTVWEIKCTSKLSIDHLLQLVIYAWIWNMLDENKDNQNKKQFKLFNVKTGELLRLDATMEELNSIVLAIIKGKFIKHEIKTDEEFITECRNWLSTNE